MIDNIQIFEGNLWVCSGSAIRICSICGDLLSVWYPPGLGDVAKAYKVFLTHDSIVVGTSDYRLLFFDGSRKLVREQKELSGSSLCFHDDLIYALSSSFPRGLLEETPCRSCQIFTTRGEYVNQLIFTPPVPRNGYHRSEMAFAGNEIVTSLRWSNQILIYGLDGNLRHEWAKVDMPELAEPTGLAFDASTGRLYIGGKDPKVLVVE
jgi:hypothetical protein